MKDIILLGSTGSIGNAVLNVVKKNKSNFKIKLLTTNKNIKKIYHQAVNFNVKKVVISDYKNYEKFSHLFRKKKSKFIPKSSSFLSMDKSSFCSFFSDFIICMVYGH